MNIKERMIRLGLFAVLCGIILGIVVSPSFAFYISLFFLMNVAASIVYAMLFGD